MSEEKLVFKPTFDRVLVKPEKISKVTEGGIHLPDNASDDRRAFEGVVAAVGPGKLNDDGTYNKMSFQVGDIVYYNKYGGCFISIGKIEYCCLPQQDIYGKLENET